MFLKNGFQSIDGVKYKIRKPRTTQNGL